MNKILIIIFSLGSSICLADDNKKLTIQTLERNMILCDTQFSRSADENRYKQCAKIVFDAYDDYIKEKRVASSFSNQKAWKDIQLNEIKQNSACQEYAKGTTTNTTLLRNLYFCQHIMYLNLANKATL